MSKGITISECSMKGFRAGSSRVTPPRGGAPATMSQLGTAQPIGIRPCSVHEGRNPHRPNPIVVLTPPCGIDTMKSRQKIGWSDGPHNRRHVDLQSADTVTG